MPVTKFLYTISALIFVSSQVLMPPANASIKFFDISTVSGGSPLINNPVSEINKLRCFTPQKFKTVKVIDHFSSSNCF